MTSTIIEADRVEVLLFDLGRVVFDFDWSRAVAVWSERSGVPDDDIVERFRKEIHYERYERGELTTDEYFARLRHQLDIDVDLDVIAEGWNTIFGELVPGITEVISAVRDSPYRIAALSNTNAAHAAVFGARYAAVLADIGRILASHELGHRKPEPGCFLAAAEHLATDPSHVLFFDDMAENADGARAVGMQAVQVRSIDNVRAALFDLGIALA
ncbi:MAG TPA: HAD family phosphatase [Acidimicrobiales bacterium]|nr:HAD family phosphatase [Acidimicrobiales bacterium]